MKSLTFFPSKQLVHRDINPESKVISNDGIVKLGDFGEFASMIEKIIIISNNYPKNKNN